MGMPDPSKPYTAEDKRWLHDWGLDWVIEDNERRFAQAEASSAGEAIDVSKVLEEAGVKVPEPPVNPLFNNVPAAGSLPDFDEDATREELAEFTVAELKAELKEMGESTEGNKAELTDRLVEALKAG